MAPEMIKGAYGKAADWWSVGILIYDMLTGNPPFQSKNDGTLQNKILKDKLKLPTYLSNDAHQILRQFLNRDEDKRLGSGSDGIKNIKKHSFFKGLHWVKLLNGEIDSPFLPCINKGMLDVANFDPEFINAPIQDSPCTTLLTNSQENLFLGFSYVRSHSGVYMESSLGSSPVLQPETPSQL
eukprot:TRINITY_DN595_c0_g1_i2.p2 TRINITY_DN595_c0_g1~~TRINITY_DN595_c0_g1_i2.p2  ORF type:complete len:182 (-),score=56.45 TRINITY_DN595_c0_g1_i2:68-613(-)